MNGREYVVLVTIEGVLVQTWLCKAGNYFVTTENLEQAHVFHEPIDAVLALASWREMRKEWLLGIEIKLKSLCQPNPG